MPLWATDPTAARRAGGIFLYQGRVSSRRESVAVARSPAIDLSHGRCLGVTTGRSTSASSNVMQTILFDGLAWEVTRHFARSCELLKHPYRDRWTINLEVSSCSWTSVRKTKAICPQGCILARNPGPDHVGQRVHVIRDSQERTLAPASF